MDKEVAILFLTVLLVSTLYPETTLAETKSFLVGGSIGWAKENNGSWFPIGTITMVVGFLLERSSMLVIHSVILIIVFTHCLITLTSIFQLLMQSHQSRNT